jgi:hypothetical protein
MVLRQIISLWVGEIIANPHRKGRREKGRGEGEEGKEGREEEERRDLAVNVFNQKK